jgi:glycosyltransferase involved in cell wall biosynthesis
VSAVSTRVIFVNRVYRPSQAATAQLLTDLAEGLAARGWSVHVIAAGEESGVINGVTIHRTGPGEQHSGLISRARNYWRFVQRARAELSVLAQPDDRVVLMSDPPMLGTALAKTVLARGAHLIHWIQDIYPEIVSAHVGAWAEVPLAPLVLERNAAWLAADRCVVLGTDMARTLSGQKIPPDQITLVPNWAPRELQETAPSAAVTAQRAAWGLTGKFIVAYSGNLGRVHEFKTVIAAAEILRDHPAIVFLFIGSGARLAKVQAAARRSKLTNLRFLPPVPRENLAGALASADVQLVTLKPAFARLVYPSKLAGVLAAGRPVIFAGPPDGEIARLLQEEKCGVTVAPGEAARLAEILVQWQTDPDRQKQPPAARIAYEKHFTFASALGRWEEILGHSGRER